MTREKTFQEAEEQFLGGGNCGKENATPNADGTGSAEVINTLIRF